MKLHIFLASGLLLLVSACGGGGDSAPPAPASDVPVSLGSDTRTRSYALAADDHLVFVFDQAVQEPALTAAGVTTIERIEVRGTFNGWKDTGLNLVASQTDAGIWYLRLPVEQINVPGNSGQPEYKFVVNGSAWLSVPAAKPAHWSFAGNHIVLFEGDSTDDILLRRQEAETTRTLAEFDLASSADQAELANFRAVPGANATLYRSYHPFKMSRPTLDTEVPRLQLVNDMMVAAGIQSVITLSKLEAADSAVGETISPYMQAIMDGGHNLALDVSYNQVYFRSETAEFGNMLAQVVDFINDDAHQPPFLIHCRLGTDRTGVVSAMLAALLGASWEDIAADYQRSNAMGIGEFRDWRLLQYSFEHMLGLQRGTIATVDLQQAVGEHLVNGGYLTEQDIIRLNQRLR